MVKNYIDLNGKMNNGVRIAITRSLDPVRVRYIFYILFIFCLKSDTGYMSYCKVSELIEAGFSDEAEINEAAVFDMYWMEDTVSRDIFLEVVVGISTSWYPEEEED